MSVTTCQSRHIPMRSRHIVTTYTSTLFFTTYLSRRSRHILYAVTTCWSRHVDHDVTQCFHDISYTRSRHVGHDSFITTYPHAVTTYTCLSRHMLCCSRHTCHDICGSRHMVCFSRHQTCSSRHTLVNCLHDISSRHILHDISFTTYPPVVTTGGYVVTNIEKSRHDVSSRGGDMS